MLFFNIVIVGLFFAVLSALLPFFIPARWSLLSKLTHFSLLGLAGLALVMSGFLTLIMKSSLYLTLSPLSISFIKASLHLDPLSGFFLCLIGIITIAIAFYGPSYLKGYENSKYSLKAMFFFTGLFLVSMSLVVLANDLFSFMFSWELMSLTSYFLVMSHYEEAETRKAGLVYLLMAHLSGLCILFAFGILVKFGNGFDFQSMQAAHLPIIWANLAFILAFLGFGMKSGLVPLHVWLPRAHPVAPSHISALMSGVMIKIAVYGFIRFNFSLIGQLHWQWGIIVLFIGSISAVLGVLYALMQHNLKQLLAYHSVENIGIIFIGLGLAILFICKGYPMLGALAMIAALYHSLNHAVFKSLLFLGAGSIYQSTHEHDLNLMGGLIQRMPQIAFFFLIGCVSISALPPFNGFVSEWLTFQAFLQVPLIRSNTVRFIVPIAAAMLALTGALAAACFAKVYGITFLGKPRTDRVAEACESGIMMRFSLGLLALFCLLLGILPTFLIRWINTIPMSLLNVGLAPNNLNHWLWITPIDPNVSSYSALLVFIGVIIICVVSWIVLRPLQHSFSFKKVTAWDCGFGGLNKRMQYTATAFAMPIRRVFKNIWTVEELKTNEDEPKNKIVVRDMSTYELHVQDNIWLYIYEPIQTVVDKISKLVSYLQQGNIRVYLAYSFFTLLLLLLVVL